VIIRQNLSFLAVFVYATHATQAFAFEWKLGFRQFLKVSLYSRNSNSSSSTHTGLVTTFQLNLGEPVPLDSPCPYRTSSLTPSHHVLRQEQDGGEGRGVEGKRESIGAEILWPDALPVANQPVLKTFTGPHPFFNHRRLLREGTSPFYICS